LQQSGLTKINTTYLYSLIFNKIPVVMLPGKGVIVVVFKSLMHVCMYVCICVCYFVYLKRYVLKILFARGHGKHGFKDVVFVTLCRATW
jgi:hypothetical protein